MSVANEPAQRAGSFKSTTGAGSRPRTSRFLFVILLLSNTRQNDIMISALQLLRACMHAVTCNIQGLETVGCCCFAHCIYLFSLCYLFMIILGLSKDFISAVAVFFSLVNTEIEPCCFVRAFSLNTILKCRYSSCPFLKCLCIRFYRCCYLLCVACVVPQASQCIHWVVSESYKGLSMQWKQLYTSVQRMYWII